MTKLKTIKQIKNLKAYGNATDISIYTAKLIAGNWNWGWYPMQDFEKKNENYYHRITEKVEFSITENY